MELAGDRETHLGRLHGPARGPPSLPTSARGGPALGAGGGAGRLLPGGCPPFLQAPSHPGNRSQAFWAPLPYSVHLPGLGFGVLLTIRTRIHHAWAKGACTGSPLSLRSPHLRSGVAWRMMEGSGPVGHLYGPQGSQGGRHSCPVTPPPHPRRLQQAKPMSRTRSWTPCSRRPRGPSTSPCS